MEDEVLTKTEREIVEFTDRELGLQSADNGADVHRESKACILRLVAEIKKLRDQNEKLRRWRCDNDCRYTMGDVADIGGRHCPLDKPCVRCSTEDEIDELRGELDATIERCAKIADQHWPDNANHECGEVGCAVSISIQIRRLATEQKP